MLVASLLICHALWWWTAGDAWVLGVLKVLMELALPTLLDQVTGVWRTASGAWMVGTTFVGPKVSGFAVSIDPFLLRKCVMWIPSALALVAATSLHKPSRVVAGALAAMVLAALLTLISAAAMLAIIVNPNPTI